MKYTLLISSVLISLTFHLFTSSWASAAPVIGYSDTGCLDYFCIWATGQNFSAGDQIRLRAIGSNTVLGSKVWDTFTPDTGAGYAVHTVRIDDRTAQYELATNGLQVSVYDPVQNVESNIFTVHRPTNQPQPPWIGYSATGCSDDY